MKIHEVTTYTNVNSTQRQKTYVNEFQQKQKVKHVKMSNM